MQESNRKTRTALSKHYHHETNNLNERTTQYYKPISIKHHEFTKHPVDSADSLGYTHNSTPAAAIQRIKNVTGEGGLRVYYQ